MMIAIHGHEWRHWPIISLKPSTGLDFYRSSTPKHELWICDWRLMYYINHYLKWQTMSLSVTEQQWFRLWNIIKILLASMCFTTFFSTEQKQSLLWMSTALQTKIGHTKFVVSVATEGCLYGNLWWRHWRQSWYHDKFLCSVNKRCDSSRMFPQMSWHPSSQFHVPNRSAYEAWNIR